MAIVQNTWSKVALPDPADYYGGYKEPRLLTVAPFRRAISDRLGNHESSGFDFTVSDVDRLMRGKMANGAASRWLLNRLVIARMISDEDRRALLIPRIVGIGWIRDYEPIPPMQFRFSCEDYLAIYTGLGQDDKQVPKRLARRTEFADLGTDRIDTPVPIIYGQVSDAASTSPAPVLTGLPAEGAYVDQGMGSRPGWPDTSVVRQIVAGYGTITTSAAAVPTGLAVVAGGVGTLSAEVPNATYGVAVTAVDAFGVETDMTPFYVNRDNQGGAGTFPSHVPTAVVNGSQELQVSWSAAAGASLYRVYMGVYSYGAFVLQMIETASLSCAFTTGAAFHTLPSTANITPGAVTCPYSALWYYAVSAVMPDGETGLSVECRGVGGPYLTRPIRVRWEAVAGALEYRVYRRGFTGDYDRRWSVPASSLFFDDDQSDTGVTYITGAVGSVGAVPILPAGTETASDGSRWFRFLLCGHAVKEIEALFVDGVRVDDSAYGTSVACPGKTGYSTFFPNTGNPQYRELNGQRFTCIYARGPEAQEVHEGRRRGTANVKGIETNGDGTGTLITDGFDQYLHAMRNWILGDYRTGAWATTGPTWPGSGTPEIEVLDDASFDAAGLAAADRIPGGYTGAFIIGANGERESVKNWVQRFNLSLDCHSGFSRRSQFFVKMMVTTVDVLDAALAYSETVDVYRDTFRLKPRVGDLENTVLYSYARNYALARWDHPEREVTDTESVTETQQEKKSAVVEMWLTRNATQAVDVAQRRLMRGKEPPIEVGWDGGLQWLTSELGDVILMTHREGIGPDGYVNHPLFLTRHGLDPDRMVVSIEALDVARLFDGAFILGDTGTLPAAWTSATQVQQRYGYLCDETTGLFSDGSPGKRLR